MQEEEKKEERKDKNGFAIGPEMVRALQHEWLRAWARVARDVSDNGVAVRS